ncbi:hypothetical protein [Larkinella terrae]|uniref:Uncharacterized protein n=1 Tax=Larkinella terrae TaxID=2025311 RepID=A0A7K0ES42_9BACT|nr:hypothetical protein [Larkinella terrae]MRS64589.1 hypothetical protein [Larkinella terrae]
MAALLYYLTRLGLISLIEAFHMAYNAKFLNAVLHEPMTFEVVFAVTVLLSLTSAALRMNRPLASAQLNLTKILGGAVWSSYLLVIARVFIDHEGKFIFDFSTFAWLKLAATLIVLAYCVLGAEVLTAVKYIARFPVKSVRIGSKGRKKTTRLRPPKSAEKQPVSRLRGKSSEGTNLA